MCSGAKLFQQFCLCPSELPHRPNIPHSFFQALTALKNGHILCPADSHGLCQSFWSIFISLVKLSHSAEVSGGETLDIGICLAEIFSGGNGSAFLRPGTDDLANLAV